MISPNFFIQRFTQVLLACLFLMSAGLSHAEWNADWPVRNKVSINPQALGLNEPAVALMRLHSGNFDFTSVNIDGSDIRVIAADDKTELKFYVEKFDAVNELATIWVQLPAIAAGEKDAHIWIYSGNETATSASNEKAVIPAGTIGLFHFAENALLKDSSASALAATGTVTAQKAGLIGESAVFSGAPLTIAANPAVVYGNGFTWSAWIKPASLPQTATLFVQADGPTLAIDAQTLQLKMGDAVVTGGELKATTWQHVAFTINNGSVTLYVNGAEVATGAVPVLTPAAEISIGDAYLGEMDEMEFANTASKAHIQLAASTQGVDSKLFTVAAGEGGEEEEGGEANYIGILISSLTLDAKIVIAILAVMFAISVWVMWSKAQLIIKTDKDNQKFLARFQKANGRELLELDRGANFPNSNLYGLYQAGLREIKKREHEDGTLSLSGASMDAIKAAIDADLVRETQRQNAGMVLLTIAISGGPFLGLLGTVVGVMITFAAIAAAGDVNVNAIAPGIAAALLATVAGLGVAIPALFGYNYLASRIKNITIAMQIFVDEFVTRTAELFGKGIGCAMSEGVKEENQLYDEINITPMLDLAYVLLVIFIIMTTASVQGVKVESPQTIASAPLAKPQMRAITITSDGAVYLDAYPVDMATLEQRLAEYKSGNPELPVVLKGDAAANYEKVSEVLEICKKLDITEVGLVTKKVTE